MKQARIFLSFTRRSSSSYVTVPFSSPRLPTMQRRNLDTLVARQKRLDEIFLCAEKSDGASCVQAGRAASKELATMSSSEGFALLDETLFTSLQQMIEIRQMFRAADILSRIVRDKRLPLPVNLVDESLVQYARYILLRMPHANCSDPGISREVTAGGGLLTSSDPYTRDSQVTGDDGEDGGIGGDVSSSLSFPLLHGTARTMALRLFLPLLDVMSEIFPRRPDEAGKEEDEGEEDAALAGQDNGEDEIEKRLRKKYSMFADAASQLEAIRVIVHEDYVVPSSRTEEANAKTTVHSSSTPLGIFTKLLSGAMMTAAEGGDTVVLQGLAVTFLNAFVDCDGSGTLLASAWTATTTKGTPAEATQLQEAAARLCSFADEFIASFYYGIYMTLRRDGAPASPRARYTAFCETSSGLQPLLDRQLQLVIERNSLAAAARNWQFFTARRLLLLDTAGKVGVEVDGNTGKDGRAAEEQEAELLDLRCRWASDGSPCDDNNQLQKVESQEKPLISSLAAPMLRKAIEQVAASGKTETPSLSAEEAGAAADDSLDVVIEHALDLCSYTLSSDSADVAPRCLAQLREVLEVLPSDRQSSLTHAHCATICIILRTIPGMAGRSDDDDHQPLALPLLSDAAQKDSVEWLLRGVLLPSLCQNPSVVGSVYGSCIELMVRCGMLGEAKELFKAVAGRQNVFASTIPPGPFKMLFDAARDNGDVELCMQLRERRQDLF